MLVVEVVRERQELCREGLIDSRSNVAPVVCILARFARQLHCVDLRVVTFEYGPKTNLIRKMPRSEEAEWWANAVYAAVQEIPRGKVTSYGHIALLLGERMATRYLRQTTFTDRCMQ